MSDKTLAEITTPGHRAFVAYWRAGAEQYSERAPSWWFELSQKSRDIWEATARDVIKFAEDEPRCTCLCANCSGCLG